MRTVLIVVFRAAIALAAVSLLYLLFVFGHTEVASPARILAAATCAGISALVAGLLQWVGLPADPKSEDSAKRKKGAAKRRA